MRKSKVREIKVQANKKGPSRVGAATLAHASVFFRNLMHSSLEFGNSAEHSTNAATSMGAFLYFPLPFDLVASLGLKIDLF